MRAQHYGVFLAVFLLAAAGCGQDPPKPATLDGTWAGVSMVGNQGKEADAFDRTIRWTIAGDTIAISDQRVQDHIKATLKVDATTNPKTIDAQGKGGGALAW